MRQIKILSLSLPQYVAGNAVNQRKNLRSPMHGAEMKRIEKYVIIATVDRLVASSLDF